MRAPITDKQLLEMMWERFPEIMQRGTERTEQEPVAWMNDSTPSGIFARHIDGARNFGCTIPLYTTPPQRTWVGLTDEEIWTVLQFRGYNTDTIEIAKSIEVKLKEKNGYAEEKNT